MLLAFLLQEGLGMVQGAVGGELEALQEGLSKRQAAAAMRTQLQLLRDTAHAQSKVITPVPPAFADFSPQRGDSERDAGSTLHKASSCEAPGLMGRKRNVPSEGAGGA